MLPQGVNMTALREVKLLKELQNARIVRLVDVFAHKQNLALVSPSSMDMFCWPYAELRLLSK